jgi:pre-mRNA-processing factor 6
MWAKKKWEDGNVPVSREVLEKAFLANPEGEAIWLAAVKLEAENGQYEVACVLFTHTRMVSPVSMSLPYLKQSFVNMLSGQHGVVLFSQTHNESCEECPKSEDVWLEAARLHVRSFSLRTSSHH